MNYDVKYRIGVGPNDFIHARYFGWNPPEELEERMKKAFLNRELQLDAFKPNQTVDSKFKFVEEDFWQ